MDCSVSQAMGCFLVVFHKQVTHRRQIVVRWKAIDLDDTYKQYHINRMQKPCDMDFSVDDMIDDIVFHLQKVECTKQKMSPGRVSRGSWACN
jgi:hypothetical protein